MMKIYNLFKTRKALVILLLISFLMPSKLVAESCLGGKLSILLPKAMSQNAPEVFHGKIIEINENDIKFEVIKVYSGDKEKYKIVDIYDTSYLHEGFYTLYYTSYSNENYLKDKAEIGDEWIVYGRKIKGSTNSGGHNGRYYVPEGRVNEYYTGRNGCSSIVEGTKLYSELSVADKIELYFVSFIYDLPSKMRDVYIIVIFCMFYILIFVVLHLFFYRTLLFFTRDSRASSNNLHRKLLFVLRYMSYITCSFCSFLVLRFMFVNSSSCSRIYYTNGNDYSLCKIWDLFINNPVTVIIMTVLPIFVAVFISRKLYKYIKKRRELVSDDENI